MIANNERKWFIFDAENKVLGRLSTEIATLLRGKNKVDFMNHKDGGDYVVVINAEKVVLTGHKEDQKRYYKHTSYIGNLKTKTVPELRAKNPEFIIEHSVLGMLPKNKLQDEFMKRLKIYKGNSHPHQNIKFANQE